MDKGDKDEDGEAEDGGGEEAAVVGGKVAKDRVGAFENAMAAVEDDADNDVRIIAYFLFDSVRSHCGI